MWLCVQSLLFENVLLCDAGKVLSHHSPYSDEGCMMGAQDLYNPKDIATERKRERERESEQNSTSTDKSAIKAKCCKNG